MKNKIVFQIPFGDKPNANGRIYRRETVEEMTEAINSKQYPITDQVTEIDPNGKVSLQDIRGFTESASYDEDDNRLEVTCKVTDDIAKLLEGGFKIVPNGIGDIDSETKEIKDYSLVQFSITNDSAFEERNR